MKTKRYPPIFQSVPTDEFTDREEIIGMLVERATNTPRDMTLSASIVGQRRLGKTAVMEQVYNRLFWEQGEVVPIYFNFEAKPTTSTEFALVYFTNFLKQYVAFRLKDSDLARLEDERSDLDKLVSLAETLEGDPITNYAGAMQYRLSSPKFSLHEKLESAIYLPRKVMEYNRARWKPETPIFVMLDEFQEVLRIDYSDGKPADTVGLYQWAVEGRKCPHFVTGSAVRLINQEVLGTGALFGRFRYIEFPPMEDVYGLELVDKLAFKYGPTISEPVAGYVVTRCGGNPFYIRSVVTQATGQRYEEIENEQMVSDLIAHEITHGQIWRDWGSQLQRYFEQINSYTISKRILFHAARYEGERILPEEIAAEVGRPVDEVNGVLKQLAFAEMLDARGGNIFYNLKDHILCDFINSQYELDVAGRPATYVREDLLQEYRRLKGKYADLVGALVEARMEALLNRFDGRTVPGRLFHVEGKVSLPRFHAVADALVKPPGGRAYQIDLQGRWREGYDIWAWVVEIKHWKKRVTADVVEKFVEAYTALAQETKLVGVVKWLVNQGGFTQGAVEAMEKHSIYYSGTAEINELLRLFGIKRLLPEEAEQEEVK
ncbi:MAG: ATP-binding protein [Chloroflexota bacterium]|nr:ATP-binding protein [Chloroflexota bacterium]